MSQEMAIIAIVKVAPGKLDRCREVFEQALVWIEANEPETLEFNFYEESSAEGTTFSIYASQAAVEKHEGSENYKKLFETVAKEELLAGAPVISKGRPLKGFRR